MTWYNKYRPASFEDVVGQELVKQVLQRSLLTGRVKQAYLFTGPKGTGKTTLARIFASQLNQTGSQPQAELDIVEMDAATRNKVENIRELIDSVAVPPIAGKYKIYIMDEVHMLSTAAWNALLKTLEEPPSYFVFIMCTTNPEKIIPTVQSRLTKLNLTSHSIDNIVGRLRYIAQKESMSIDEDSLRLIAKRSNGGQRDAINLLETLYGYGLELYNEADTAKLLGLLPKQFLYNTGHQILTGRISRELLTELQSLDTDGETFLGQLLDYLLDSWLEGNNQLSSLIQPAATILSLRLPLNSPAAAVAMLHSRFDPNQTATFDTLPPEPDTPPKISPPPMLTRPTKSEFQASSFTDSKVASGSHTSNKNLDSSSSSQTDVSAIDPTIALSDYQYNPPAETGNDQNQAQESQKLPSVTEIQNFIRSLQSNTATFVTLKLMLHDLEVESLQNNQIELSVSNNIFLVQLNNSKTLQFLTTQIRDRFNHSYTLNTVLRTSRVKSEISNSDSYSYSDSSQTSDTFDQHAFSTKSGLTESQNSFHINSAPAQSYNDSDEKEYFYEIYKQAPENFTNKEIKIYDKPISEPVRTDAKNTEHQTQETGESKDTSEWDELISEFELE